MAVSVSASHKGEKPYAVEVAAGLDVGELLCQGQLGLSQITQVHNHQQILHVVIKHVLELFRVDAGDALDEGHELSSDGVVGGDASSQHIVHVLQHGGQHVLQLRARARHLLHVRRHRHRALGVVLCLRDEVEADTLRIVGCYFDVDWGEDCTEKLARDSHTCADVCFGTHMACAKSCVNSEMDRVLSLTGIILVQQKRMLGHLRASGVPADDLLSTVDLLMQLKHSSREVHIDSHFVPLGVRNSEAICYLNSPFLISAEKSSNNPLSIFISTLVRVNNTE